MISVILVLLSCTWNFELHPSANIKDLLYYSTLIELTSLTVTQSSYFHLSLQNMPLIVFRVNRCEQFNKETPNSWSFIHHFPVNKQRSSQFSDLQNLRQSEDFGNLAAVTRISTIEENLFQCSEILLPHAVSKKHIRSWRNKCKSYVNMLNA